MSQSLPFSSIHRAGLGAMLAATLLAAGCASSVKLDDTPVETRAPKAVDSQPATQSSQSGVNTVDLNKNDLGASAVGKVVYFDFDSFVVKEEFRSVLEGNAKMLNASKQRKLTIEGHTDERGGREYNLALGQKRAEAVQKSLALLGVADGQMESVSYGEERPAVQGSDEAAWAKNRRAELKDR
ncbi:peptidoglycan-associated lipoprotein Pal [Ideonella sp.]|uniref:peptidoglycan-associated lipoprotein Pal n=1 Tax=Ideonella sp. TaxID=1929293 RepID=UPI00351ABDDB